MKEQELTLNEFQNKESIMEAKDILKILQHKYLKEYQQTIDSLIGYCQDMDILDGMEPKKYSVEDIHKIFEAESIIEYLDEFIEEEVLINYFVTDSVGTDKGIWNMVIENGYELIH